MDAVRKQAVRPCGPRRHGASTLFLRFKLATSQTAAAPQARLGRSPRAAFSWPKRWQCRYLHTHHGGRFAPAALTALLRRPVALPPSPSNLRRRGRRRGAVDVARLCADVRCVENGLGPCRPRRRIHGGSGALRRATQRWVAACTSEAGVAPAPMGRQTHGERRAVCT